METCQHIVHPLKKGVPAYYCKRIHYKDGWCHQHHPAIIEAKEAKYAARRLEHRQSVQNSLTIDNAIVLLVKSGYRVELLIPNRTKEE